MNATGHVYVSSTWKPVKVVAIDTATIANKTIYECLLDDKQFFVSEQDIKLDHELNNSSWYNFERRKWDDKVSKH